MAKVNELPPVPEQPVLPPEVAIRDEEPLAIESDDGVALEGRIAIPSGARRVVVIAHPHPLYGGTMHNAVVVALAKVLVERGAAVVRFDFRGVGRSAGRHDGGQLEIGDVVGALRAASRALPGAPVTAVGYSFGSWVTHRAVLRRAAGVDVERVALIAPAARLFDFVRGVDRASPGEASAFAGPKAIVLGDHDEFCDVDEAMVIARHLEASLCVVRGADHFFLSGRRRVAELLAPFALGEVDTLPAEAAPPAAGRAPSGGPA